MKTKHVKIHAHLFFALIISSIFISVIAINQSIAATNESESKILIVSSSNFYSDETEVELKSAPEYSPEIIEKKEKYKDIFQNDLNKILKKQSIETLEKVIEKINDILENTKNNNRISETNRTKLLAQLLAIKELIEELMENNTDFSVDFDLEELLAV